MRSNVIFDIGNVLLVYDPLTWLLEKYPEPLARQLMEAVFLCGAWAGLDEGTVTLEEARGIMERESPAVAEHIGPVLERWVESFVPIPAAVELATHLKEQGCGVYYLSNISEASARHILKVYDFFSLFDGGVFSYREQLVKPDAAIFHRLLERYGLKAADCVFIDDTAVHVQTARSLGMAGIVLENPTQLKAQLEQVLGDTEKA